MTSAHYFLAIAGTFGATLVYLMTEKLSVKLLNLKSDKVSFESAKLALERLGTWTTWLTGLQTAAMAAMALLVKEKDKPMPEIQKAYGFFALLFFGASIILSTWLLSSIPSAQMRLSKDDEPNEQNDIYRMKIFSFIPFTIGRFSGIVHTYFLLGVVFFALFIFSLF